MVIIAPQFINAFSWSAASSADGVTLVEEAAILGTMATLQELAAAAGAGGGRCGSAGTGPTHCMVIGPNAEIGMMSIGPDIRAKSRIDVGAEEEKMLGITSRGRMRSQSALRTSLIDDIPKTSRNP